MSRPRLDAVLDQALGHRLALVTADAGFGKTTLLASWTAGINAVVHDVTPADRDLSRFVRHVVEALRLRVPELPRTLTATLDGGHSEVRFRPDATAELLGAALERHLLRDVALVLDNGHLLTDGPSTRFLAGLIRHAPPLLHLVVAGRTPPPVPLDRLRDRGDVLELHGADLDFTPGEVAELLTAVLGEDAAGLAPAVHAATAGWPAAVRLSVEALREVPPSERAGQVAELAGGRVRLNGLVDTIYQQEPAETKRLLATVALFDEVTVELLEALGLAARAPVGALVRRGLFLEPGSSGAGWYRLHAIAHDVVARHGADAGEATALRRTAAHWLAGQGLPRLALRTLLTAGQPAEVVALLRTWGTHLMSHGHAEDVTEAVIRLPVGLRDRSLERLAGEAYQLRGEWEPALACYARAAPVGGPLDAGLAWRIGLIRYLRGELDAALSVYRRGRTDGPETRDTALLLGWTASCHWMRGDPEECGRYAAQALRVATRVDDPQALAAAHTVLAMLAAYEGDRRGNGAHYLKALQYAERAGDVLQLVRIRCNRGSHHLEEGDYAEALAELDIAIRLADLSGFAAFGALALTNRGEALLGLGRLEEAQRDLEAAVTAFIELESGLVANPLQKLGTLHLLRGDTDTARQAYEEALARAEAAGDVQARVPALAGLARLLADSDPGQAAELAKRAVAEATGISAVEALLAAGWVAYAAGERTDALRYADDATAAARIRRDRPGLAGAATLRAAATEPDQPATQAADHAVALWAEATDPIGLATAELVRAERLDPVVARPVLERVRTRMRAIGCRLLDARAEAALARLAPVPASPVRIRTLGGFRVVRDGQPVPQSAWKSRKARDLLKILVSRRGRPVSHEQVCDILWPGEPPATVANRFNVLVSTVRSLLDPDRSRHPDGYLSNDADSLRLCVERLDVDVESFLADAAAGVRLLRERRDTEGVERLARAEATYTGDFLEEDPYADWTAAMREEARATYQEVTTRLARHAREAGDPDAAVRYLLRVLERDPYDERNHLELVSVLTAAGRHGDARRHYRGYCVRMEELGVEAAPFLPGTG